MQIKLQEPIFTTTTRVIYGDTDAAGVVYNANFLRYFEIGRTEMMRAWVCSYRDIEALGFVLPVAEFYTRLKAPAHYDDVLSIDTSIDSLRRYSCRFNYRITRHDPDRGRPKLLAKGYTVHASINREGKLTELPGEITGKLEAIIKKQKQEQ